MQNFPSALVPDVASLCMRDLHLAVTAPVSHVFLLLLIRHADTVVERERNDSGETHELCVGRRVVVVVGPTYATRVS